MSDAIVFISGASSGIGAALARTVPWPGARVVDISRRGLAGVDHVTADLADPRSWPAVADVFRRDLLGFDGDVVVFIHSAGTLDPIGFAGEVDTAAYARNVVLNSASPQVLGHAFLAASRALEARRHLVLLTSGAARNPYEGWSAYGAAKAAVDQWVRAVGAEQSRRGGAHVMAVAPGVVDTAMQARIRDTPEGDFPERAKFVDLHDKGHLASPETVAGAIWGLLDRGLDNGAVVDLRQLASA